MFTHRRKNIGEAKVGLTKHHSRVPPFIEKLRCHHLGECLFGGMHPLLATHSELLFLSSMLFKEIFQINYSPDPTAMDFPG